MWWEGIDKVSSCGKPVLWWRQCASQSDEGPLDKGSSTECCSFNAVWLSVAV